MRVTILLTAIAGIIVAAWLVVAFNRQVPRCGFIGDREIVTRHCIPYCPPDPKECG